MFHTPPVLEANQKLAGVGLPSRPCRLIGMAGAAAAGKVFNPAAAGMPTTAIMSADTANQRLVVTPESSTPNLADLRASRHR